MTPSRFAWSALLLAVPAFHAATAQEAAPAKKPALIEGMPAPQVRFGGHFKGEPLQALDPEGTYVLEFWSVDCASCTDALPHLAAVAKEMGGKAVFISVNVWDEDAAEIRKFVEKHGDQMGHHVVRDQGGFMWKNWVKDAGHEGIPMTFVVVKGKVALIGHPIELDAALLAGLRDGSFTAADLAERRKQDDACGKEFRAAVRLPIQTDARRRDAIAALRKLAAKYPKAKYPGLMIRLYEEDSRKN